MKALRDASPQARLPALCSLPRTNPGNELVLGRSFSEFMRLPTDRSVRLLPLDSRGVTLPQGGDKIPGR